MSYALLSEAHNILSGKNGADMNSKYNRAYSPLKLPTHQPGFPDSSSGGDRASNGRMIKKEVNGLGNLSPYKEKFNPNLDPKDNDKNYIPQNRRPYDNYYKNRSPNGDAGQYEPMDEGRGSYHANVDFKTIGRGVEREQNVYVRNTSRDMSESERLQRADDIEAIVQRRVQEELEKRDLTRIEKFTGIPKGVLQSLMLVLTGVFIILSLDLTLKIVLSMK